MADPTASAGLAHGTCLNHRAAFDKSWENAASVGDCLCHQAEISAICQQLAFYELLQVPWRRVRHSLTKQASLALDMLICVTRQIVHSKTPQARPLALRPVKADQAQLCDSTKYSAAALQICHQTLIL